ncbi:MAG: UDP-N-acetylmuramoyl-L-alanine--D-glutamate ligase [Planctomycetota bacterium]|jgi:UDP-N-acetylmuramoylalanine--D-glutamate ligase
MKKGFFRAKNVLVMGLGRFGGGVDVAKFACRAGAKVKVTDLDTEGHLGDSLNQLHEFSDIEYRLGSHDRADFEQADVVIANPAVAPDNEFLESARERGKIVTSQVNIFFQLCPASIIGITGANGKSTTAALTAHLLKAGASKSTPHRTQYAIRNTQYENVWLSGNIGNEPMLEVIDRIEADDLVVLEISSFQLEQLAQIAKAPRVALLTNLTPNHLDRHGSFENYCAAKEHIFKLQELNDNRPAVSIFNAEDKIASQWFEKYRTQAGRICTKFSADDVSEEIRRAFALPGRANVSNLAGALAIARCFGVDDEQIASCLPQFKPLPHRLELVAEINGVRWYNDSISTTPQSTIAALEAFDEPKIVIAGGYDKNLPFAELGEKIAREAKTVIPIGQTAEKIASSIRNANMSLRGAKRRSNLNSRNTQYAIRNTKIEPVANLADAVHLAAKLASPGDVVLLSPACASYDMFDNFQHRGREFIKLVREIRS